MKITEDTNLEELKLPYLETILEEVFLIPLGPLPESVKELSEKSGLGLDETRRRLSHLKSLCAELFYQKDLALEEEVLYLDASLRKAPGKEKYSPVLSLSDPHFKDALLDLKQRNTLTLVYACSDSRAFSAAMYLREQGFKKVFLLESQSHSPS